MKRIFLYFMLLFPICLLANISAGEEDVLQTVRLQLKWKHQFQFAGYYAAIEKGYYQEAGLDVELIEATLDANPYKALSNGQTDFLVGTSEVVLMRNQGEPIVVLASIFQHSAMVLLTSESSGIKNVHDLVGKKVMFEGHSADIVAFMNDEGISLDDIERVPHAFDVKKLTNGEVDAMTAYMSDEPFKLQQQNLNYNIISPNSGGIDFYGDVLLTSENLFREKTEMVMNFRAATIKGWEYAMQNKPEIIEIIYDKYTQRHSKEHLMYEANKMNQLIRQELVEIGYSNPGRWQHIINVYKQRKLIAPDFQLQGLLYADYIKKPFYISVKLLLSVLIPFILVLALAIFFYNLSHKLRLEVIQRKKAQESLAVSQSELLKSHKEIMELSAFREKMMRMIVHDLKTPISTIINIKKYAKEKNFPELVEESGYKMLNMVHKMLDVYKNKEIETSINLQVCKLSELINSAYEQIKHLAKSKDITFKINSHLDCQIKLDELKIRRTTTNILSNAIKNTPDHGNIWVEIIKQGEALVKVSIFNEGKLPDPKLISKHFIRNSKQGEDSKFDMAFCQMTIEQHKGEIGMNALADNPVEFWFTLPNVISFSSINNIQKKQNQLTELNVEDINYLKTKVLPIKDIEVYEVSVILKCISTIDVKNDRVLDWINEMHTALNEIDAEKHKELLNKIYN